MREWTAMMMLCDMEIASSPSQQDAIIDPSGRHTGKRKSAQKGANGVLYVEQSDVPEERLYPGKSPGEPQFETFASPAQHILSHAGLHRPILRAD